MFAITDLIDPENEEVVGAIGIELFGDDSFTTRSYRAPGDSRAVLSCVVLSILAHAQSYQVLEVPRKPRLPNAVGQMVLPEVITP